MNIRKTQRKNKTKQVIIWPSNDDYFTIKNLITLNPHMITSSGSDITLRVRLNKAICDDGLVGVIGHKNCGKGRPELVFAMKPIKQIAADKAKLDGIMIDTPRTITVVNISSQSQLKANVNPVLAICQKQTVNA